MPTPVLPFDPQRLRGRFLVFDGPDGAGKTTQREMLQETLTNAGLDVVCTRDPGGTVIGDRVRSVLLDYDLQSMDVTCETLLFMASRAQLVSEVIKPALANQQVVICDRFITSTCAYQGAAGFDPKRVIELGHYAVGNCWPDLTIILDISADAGFDRIGRKAHHAGRNRTSGEPLLFEGSQPDAMEARSIQFHRTVREMFLQVEAYYPAPVRVIPAAKEPSTVFNHIIECMAHVFA